MLAELHRSQVPSIETLWMYDANGAKVDTVNTESVQALEGNCQSIHVSIIVHLHLHLHLHLSLSLFSLSLSLSLCLCAFVPSVSVSISVSLSLARFIGEQRTKPTITYTKET